MTTNDHDSTTGPASPGPGGTTTTDGSAPAPVGHTSGWSDSGFDAESAKQTFTRPEGLRRSRTDRKVAGVCGGLGLQLGIDPTIVRVGMVVLTIAGGVGIPLYIILALLMPNEGADTTTVGSAVGPHLPEQVRSGPGLAILVVVLTLILGAVFGGAFNNQFWGGGAWPWPLVIAGIVGWLIYRKRRDADPTGGAPAGAAGTTGQPLATHRIDVPVDPADPGAPGPDFWSRPDPLGLYDTPADVVAPVAPRVIVRKKRASFLIVLATLFVAAASFGGLVLATVAGASTPPVLFGAVPALIVGAGLLMAARRGGSRLLVVAAVVLGIGTAGLTQANLPSTFASEAYARMGTATNYAPSTLAEITARSANPLPDGRTRIDLTGVDFGTGTTTLDLSMSDGALQIVLPKDLDVSANVDVAARGWGGLGTEDNRFQGTSGGDTGRSVSTTDDGKDGPNPGGPHLNLGVAIDHGAVILERSNA